MDVLMNVHSPHKGWSTLKSAVISSSSSLSPLVSEGGGLVCESVGNADLLLDHFDSKQSMEAVDLPLTSHLSPSLTTFGFMSSEVRRLLLDLNPCGGTDPSGLFLLFLKSTADVMALHLSVVFWWAACSSGKFPGLQEAGQCHPNSERSTVLICCNY